MTNKEFAGLIGISSPVGLFAYRLAIQLKLLVDTPKEITVEQLLDPTVRFGIRARLSFGRCDSPALRTAFRFIQDVKQSYDTLQICIRFSGHEPPPDWDGKPHDMELWCADTNIKLLYFEAGSFFVHLDVLRELFGYPPFNGRMEDYFTIPSRRNPGGKR